jgi:hypothetical protein
MAVKDFPKISTSIPPTEKVFYLDSGLAIFPVPSNPEGIVSAAPGSFAIDNAGNWYRKASGIGNTGWGLNNGGGGGASVTYFKPITTNVSNVGTAFTDFHSFSLPIGALNVDGTYARFNMNGVIAQNTNNKTLNVFAVVPGFGGLIVGAPTPDASIHAGGGPQNVGWELFGKIVRVAQDTILFTVTIIFGWSLFNSSGTNLALGHFIAPINLTNLLPGLDVSTVPIGIATAGQGAASGDISQNFTSYELYQFT